MSTKQEKNKQVEKNSIDRKPIKQFTPQEEQEFIASLINDSEEWTAEEEARYQKVTQKL